MEHKGTQPLETARLVLRPFVMEDAPAMFNNWASDGEVTKFLTWPTHRRLFVTETVLKAWTENYQNKDFYQWAVAFKDGGEPVGCIGVNNQIDERVRSAVLGYCFGRRWWHMGVASEALSGVLPFLFNEVGVNRVEAVHDPRNPRSGAVMRKCGLKYEGTLRQSSLNNSGVCDECVCSMLAEEFFSEK